MVRSYAFARRLALSGMAVSGVLALPGSNLWFNTAVTAAGTTTATGSSGATIDCNFGFR